MSDADQDRRGLGRRRVLAIRFRFSALILLLAVGKATAAPPATPVLLPGYPMLAGGVAIIGWLPVPGAVAYKVYCNGAPLLTVETTQAIIPMPQSSGQYSFCVSALGPAGEEGPAGETRVLSIKTLDAPGKVVAFPAADGQSIDLLWGGVPGVLHYQAYRAADSADFKPLATTRTPSLRDGDVRAEGSYRYRVTAIDKNGQESPPSMEVAVSLREAPRKPSLAQRLVRRADRLRLLPVRQTLTLTRVGELDVDGLTHLQTGPDGLVWVILPASRRLLGLGEHGRPVRTIGPEVFEGQEGFTPHKMDIGPEGEFYITDISRGELLRLDSQGKASWRRRVVPPPVEDKRAWRGFPDRYLTYPPRPSSVLCRGDGILVTDQWLQVLYRFGMDGTPGSCVTHYARGGTEWRLGRVGEVEDLGEDLTLLTFPLQRRAIAINAQNRVVMDLGGDKSGVEVCFLGINGARRVCSGPLLLTDPALGTVLAVDAGTGFYLYHLGHEDPPEPLRLDRPRQADMDQKGRYWVFVAGENRIAVFTPASQIANAR